LESFSKGMNFSIVILLSWMGVADDSRNAAACQPQRLNATVCAFREILPTS
jgi:hypothetical protein